MTALEKTLQFNDINILHGLASKLNFKPAAKCKKFAFII